MSKIMNLKYIIFDFNGTILDDVIVSFEIVQRLARKHHAKSFTFDEYLDKFSFPVINYYEALGFDLTKENFAEISDEFYKTYLASWKTKTSLAPGIVDLFRLLKSKKINIYIITASEEKLLYAQLKHFKLENYIDGVAACINNQAKGKKEYGLEFITMNHLKPAEGMMIGDTIHDYEVAKHLGVTPILYAKGHNSLKLLMTTKTRVYRSFADFADYISTIV